MRTRRKQTTKTRLPHGTEQTCKCGCLTITHGRAVFASPACRKRHQRNRERQEATEQLNKTLSGIGLHNRETRFKFSNGFITKEGYEKKLIRVAGEVVF